MRPRYLTVTPPCGQNQRPSISILSLYNPQHTWVSKNVLRNVQKEGSLILRTASSGKIEGGF